MSILLATPIFSQHFDAGLFWIAAASRLEEAALVWDWRRQADFPAVPVDLFLALKGNAATAAWRGGRVLRKTARVAYWPDALGRDPLNEALLSSYDLVYTCLRPTPDGMIWLPTGFDPYVHYPRQGKKEIDTVFIGTQTPRKLDWLKEIGPDALFGNGWADPVEAIYLEDYCQMLSRARISINIHRDPGIGLNRRFYESIACTFTLMDLVPGVEEVLGKDLAKRVAFENPRDMQNAITHFLRNPDEAQALWEQERAAIQPYTYQGALRRVIEEAYRVYR